MVEHDCASNGIYLIWSFKSSSNILKYKWEMISAITVVVVILAIFGSLTIYTQNWPPAVVVESKSMQHGNNFVLGVINTGDIVGMKKVYSQNNVITYVVARELGGPVYYGDFGDVVIYDNTYLGELVIHRAMFYVSGWNGDTPIIANDNNPSWLAINGYNVTILNVGYAHRNLLVGLGNFIGTTGYVTMGDYNLANSPFKEGSFYLGADVNVGIDNSLVNITQVRGIAVGYLPILGTLKLWIDGKTQYIPELSNIVMALVIVVIVAAAFFPTKKDDRKDQHIKKVRKMKRNDKY